MSEVFGRARAIARAQPASRMSGKRSNNDKSPVNNGRLRFAGYPCRGEGCGEGYRDTLHDRIILKERSNFG
jgi:hypothetical protein